MQVKNSFLADLGTVVDKSDGVVSFPNGLVLNSGEPMRDGLRYDVNSLDIENYDNGLYASHDYYTLSSKLGRLTGVQKKDGQLIATGAEFAVGIENLQAELAYKMVVNGWLTTVSIGTMGFPATEEGVYENHEIYETSLVLVPNDPRAKINESPLAMAVANGLDVTPFLNPQAEKKETVNTVVEEPIKQTKENKVSKEDTKVTPAVETAKVETPDMEAMLNSAMEKMSKKFEAQLETISNGLSVQDAPAVAPVVNAQEETASAIKNMTDGQRLAQQIRIASSSRVTSEDADMLAQINAFHAAQITGSDKIEDAIKNNVHTTTDELTGIVAPASVYERMYDVVTQYSGILSALPYRATDSVLYEYRLLASKMSLSWLGAKEDDGADGNLKPLTSFSIKKQLREMDHYAGVMVFSDYALRTGAVDLLDEFARQAREAQDRILAELTIATMEQAVEQRVAGATIDGFVIPADATGSQAFVATGATEKVTAQKLVDFVNEFSGQLVDGVMFMSKATSGTLRVNLGLTANQALSRTEIGEDPVLSNVFGHSVVTVPNGLMPKINSGATATVGHPNGAVTVDHAIYFMERSNWDAKILGGGSSFDSSDKASYEVGGVTKSAYQRNETVVKAYGYAMAQVLDFRFVLGIQANA